MRIFTVTLNTAIDVIVKEKDYKRTGLKKSAEIPAGKGINVARALKSAKLPSHAIALVGENDVPLFESIGNDFITAHIIPVKGETRRNITLSHTEDGLEHHERLEGFTVTEDDFKKVTDCIMDLVSEGDWVIFSGSLPQGISINSYSRLIKLCKTMGAYTGLDTSNGALLTAISSSPYFLKANLEELEEIKGSELSAKEDIEDCVKKVSAAYDIPSVMVTFAEKGALIYIFEEDRFIYSDALPEQEEKVSSVGCGDACVAGMMAGMLRRLSWEESLDEAMKYANANLYTVTPGDLDIKYLSMDIGEFE